MEDTTKKYWERYQDMLKDFKRVGLRDYELLNLYYYGIENISKGDDRVLFGWLEEKVKERVADIKDMIISRMNS